MSTDQAAATSPSLPDLLDHVEKDPDAAYDAFTDWAGAQGTPLYPHQDEAVIELLGRQQCCLTAQEIFDRLRTEGRRVGTASVYRALEQLTKDGFVQRVDLGEGTSRYEPIHADGAHHHHLVCRSCGRTVEVSGPAVERWANAVAAEHGFRQVSHDLEIFGTCADC